MGRHNDDGRVPCLPFTDTGLQSRFLAQAEIEAGQLFGKMPEAGSGESKFTLRMPDSLRDRLAERAKANNQSLNAWIVRCLESCAAQAVSDAGAAISLIFRQWAIWLAAIGRVGGRRGLKMAPPHDFEFQLGRNRILRGRGWRGLLALGFFLITCVMIATGSSWITSTIAYFGR
jgi:hypothetical protein